MTSLLRTTEIALRSPILGESGISALKKTQFEHEASHNQEMPVVLARYRIHALPSEQHDCPRKSHIHILRHGRQDTCVLAQLTKLLLPFILLSFNEFN